MIKKLLKQNKRKHLYIFQLTDGFIKVIKCLVSRNSNVEFKDLEIEPIWQGITDKELSDKINTIFKKLGADGSRIVISLPRNNATCRYVKVPASNPEEIENIVSLQASRYLPYSPDELVTGYEVTSTDSQGYTYANLVIAHRGIIERYFKIFKELGFAGVDIILSSYGLSSLYNYLATATLKAVIVIDIDYNYAELDLIVNRNLLYSRAFKIHKHALNWENSFFGELVKTMDACSKEFPDIHPEKIVIFGSSGAILDFAKILEKDTHIPVEIVSLDNKINISAAIRDKILKSDLSFASLIGLALCAIPEALKLIPPDLKVNIKNISLKKERLKFILFSFVSIITLALAMVKDIDNKNKYDKFLDSELKAIEIKARPLEELEHKLKLLEERLQKKPSSLNAIYELYKVIPLDIYLVNLSYEDDTYLNLRGQALKLNSVFALISSLEESDYLRNFNAKVKYATKKNTQQGEIVDFEIVCSREK